MGENARCSVKVERIAILADYQVILLALLSAVIESLDRSQGGLDGRVPIGLANE